MELTKKQIITREAIIYAPVFILIFIVSIYGATNSTVIDGEMQTNFFTELFVLNVIAWNFIYVVFRSALLLIGSRRGK